MNADQFGGDKIIRRVAFGAVGVVSAIAATVGFLHILNMAYRYQQPAVAAWLLPFSVDGTILYGSLVSLYDARKGRKWKGGPKLPKTMAVLGVLATLAANVLFGLRAGAIGATISAWPALAMIGGIEVMIGLISREAAVAAEAAEAAAEDEDEQADQETETPQSKRREVARAILQTNPNVSGASLGRAVGIGPEKGLLLRAELLSEAAKQAEESGIAA